MTNVATDFNINLKIKKLKNTCPGPEGPIRIWLFSLVHHGQLLEDHHLSETRFISILKKELARG